MVAIKAGAVIKAGVAVKAMSVAQSTYNSSSSDTVSSLPVPEPPNLQKHSTHPILSSLHPSSVVTNIVQAINNQPTPAVLLSPFPLPAPAGHMPPLLPPNQPTPPLLIPNLPGNESSNDTSSSGDEEQWPPPLPPPPNCTLHLPLSASEPSSRL